MTKTNRICVLVLFFSVVSLAYGAINLCVYISNEQPVLGCNDPSQNAVENPVCQRKQWVATISSCQPVPIAFSSCNEATGSTSTYVLQESTCSIVNAYNSPHMYKCDKFWTGIGGPFPNTPSPADQGTVCPANYDPWQNM